MNVMRNNVFETNSSSCHTLTFYDKLKEKGYYTLTKDGYILVSCSSFYSESDYRNLKTLEEKLSLILSMISTFCYEQGVKEGKYSGYFFQDGEYLKYADLKKDKSFKEVNEILKRRIPGCKGLKLSKKTLETIDGVLYFNYSVDPHHILNCKDIYEYCKQAGVTLEQLVMSPRLYFQLNV